MADNEKKILLVDDDSDLRTLLARFFTKHGYQVDSAWTVKEGLAKYKSACDSLVIVDFRLEDGDGLQFLKTAFRLNPNAIVIITTGYSDVRAAVECIKAGAFDYITKPLFPDEILATVRRGFEKMEAAGMGLQRNDIKTDEYIGLTLNDGKIKVIRLADDGEYAFQDERDQLHNIIYTTSLESILLRQAIEEFEYLINKNDVKENELHNFFVRNPDFILTDEHKKAHSKIVLSSPDSGLLIPDFVLEPFDTKGLSDLLDIKLPQVNNIHLKKNRDRFSSDIHEAGAQLAKYASFFEESRNREKIKDKYGLSLYNPSMIVVIGRANNLNPVDYKRIQGQQPHLTVKNYDQLLSRMQRKVR